MHDGATDLQSASAKSKLDFEFFFNFSSPHTRRAYRIDLNAFFNFLFTLAPELNDLKAMERFHVVAYRQWMEGQQMAPKTINRRLSSLSSYCDFLVAKQLIEFNPCQAIKRPRQEVVTPTKDLTDEQVTSLMQALHDTTSASPLHRAVIYLLFSTGIRVSELANLKLKDFHRDGEHWVIDIVAKGGKHLSKVVHPRCAEVLQEYLNWQKETTDELSPEDSLLRPTRNPLDGNDLNKPLNPKSIEYIIKTWCRRAGIFERISPHSARATYIGSALDAGQDIYRISRDVGHASVQTTQIYDKRRHQHDESPAYSLGYLSPLKKSS